MKFPGWKKRHELEARPVNSRRVVQSGQRANKYQYFRQSEPNPETEHGQALIKRQRRLALGRAVRGKRGPVIILFLLLAILWAGSVTNVVVGTIVEDQAGKADARDVRAVENIISTGGIRNHYILTMDEKEASARIRDKRPDILAVRYTFSPFHGTLNVDLVQSPVVLIVQNKEQFAYLNLDGVVSQIRRDPPSDDELRVYPLLVDDSSLPIEMGKVFIPKDIVEFIRDVEKAAQIKSLETHTYSLPVVPREVRMKFADASYYIKLSTMQPARDQLQAVVDIRNYFKKNKITPGEYVDLRVAEKAYYK